jgi:putative transposase
VQTGRPNHLKTFDYSGLHRYFLTFCTHERRRIFVTSDVVDDLLSQIQRAADAEGFAILAYCFMPDHLHILIEGEVDHADGRRFIARAKQLSGFYYSQKFRETLWQRYGFERVLRNDEATLSVARYIVENPLRAGLVAAPAEYPFSGSTRYSLKEILEAIAIDGIRKSG